MPWWHTGASGGAAWPWLGAANNRDRCNGSDSNITSSSSSTSFCNTRLCFQIEYFLVLEEVNRSLKCQLETIGPSNLDNSKG
jgi:hypothetical protein